jgi:hypothetical protein
MLVESSGNEQKLRRQLLRANQHLLNSQALNPNPSNPHSQGSNNLPYSNSHQGNLKYNQGKIKLVKH